MNLLRIGQVSQTTFEILIGIQFRFMNAEYCLRSLFADRATVTRSLFYITVLFSLHRYIQPLVNPDGYEYSHRVDRYWRKNRSLPPGSSICKGVDLNRNFGFKWGGLGTSANPCAQTYRGPHAFSEPESEAQRQFFAQTKERFRAFLTFHSYGQYILYPWGYAVNEFTSDQEQLDQLGRTAAQV